MISCNGQSHRRAIDHRYLSLHQPLTKTRTTNNRCTIPILQRSRDDLACRCRCFVNQHRDLTLQELAVGTCRVGLSRDNTSLSRNHSRPLGQEVARHFDRGLDQSTTVAAQIQNELLGLRHTLHRLAELLHRLASKAINLDICRRGRDHIGGIDRRNRDLATHDGEAQRTRLTVACDLDIDLGALLAAQERGYFALFDTDNTLTVNCDDAIIRHYTNLG